MGGEGVPEQVEWVGVVIPLALAFAGENPSQQL
jgi:hypothetical protein